jgi:hypothetical protein
MNELVWRIQMGQRNSKMFSRFDIRCHWHHLISNLENMDRKVDSILDGMRPSKFDIRCHRNHLISNLKNMDRKVDSILDGIRPSNFDIRWYK